LQNHPTKIYLKRITDWTSAETIKEALLSLWQKLDIDPSIEKTEFVGLKLTFGEEHNSGYIKPEWLSGLIAALREKTENLFIVETNTLYREKRSNSVGHLHVARSHGFDLNTLGIPIIIADGLRGRDMQNVSIRGGEHFENVKLAKGICESDRLIFLSHVTGHCQAGLAGALKNIGMGCASRQGKLSQHSRTLPEVTVEKCAGCGECMKVCPANAIGLKKKKALLVKERCIGCGECTVACDYGAIEIKYDESIVKFQEKMVEYVMGVKKALDSNMACVNFLCNIGIVAGLDPVAVDKASLDLIGEDVFKDIYPDIDPMTQIRYAEKIKLGSSLYELLEV
jgi:uncharacterized Fe-S center protein